MKIDVSTLFAGVFISIIVGIITLLALRSVELASAFAIATAIVYTVSLKKE